MAWLISPLEAKAYPPPAWKVYLACIFLLCQTKYKIVLQCYTKIGLSSSSFIKSKWLSFFLTAAQTRISMLPAANIIF